MVIGTTPKPRPTARVLFREEVVQLPHARRTVALVSGLVVVLVGYASGNAGFGAASQVEETALTPGEVIFESMAQSRSPSEGTIRERLSA